MKLKIFFLLAGSAVLIFSFQNCGGGFSSSQNISSTSTDTNDNANSEIPDSNPPVVMPPPTTPPTTSTTTPPTTPVVNGLSARMALEIISPQPNLNKINRYYKTYPNIQYSVPIAVIGGVPPYTYTLETSPTGMKIGAYGTSNYEQLIWDSPTSGSHPIKIKVQDQVGGTQTISWNLTVTTDKFLFVDAVNGNDSNAGTISSPFKTIFGWYKNAKHDGTYARESNDAYFVIYRAGTYAVAAPGSPLELYDTTFCNSYRLAINLTDKPSVHLGYPGEKVIFNAAGANLSYDGISDVFIDNIHWQNSTCASHYESFQTYAATRLVVYRSIFETTVKGVTGSNPGQIFYGGGGSSQRFQVFSYNSFMNLENALGVEAYGLNKFLFSHNTFSSMKNSALIYLKSGNQLGSLRNNTAISSVTGESPLLFLDTYSSPDQIQLIYNSYKGQPNYNMLHIGNEPNGIGQLWIDRNTFVGGRFLHAYSGSGSATYFGNLVQHDGAFTHGSDVEGARFSIIGLDKNTNLVGTFSYVDSNNKLTGSYRTQYLGLFGFEN